MALFYIVTILHPGIGQGIHCSSSLYCQQQLANTPVLEVGMTQYDVQVHQQSWLLW